MNYLKAFQISLLIIVVLFTFNACSKGSSNPVVGSFTDGYIMPEIHVDQLPESNDLIGTGMLGAYSLDISPDYSSAELVPARGSSLGESFIVSGSAYFWTQPCRDCLRISSIGLDADENIVLGFSLSHPLEKGDPGQPPSGKNRLDLDIFDVELRLSSEGHLRYPFRG